MSEKLNIAIVIDQLSYGGVVKVLGDLLKFTAPEFATITVFLRDFDEEVSIDIPDNAKLQPWPKQYTISSALREKGIGKAIYVLYNKSMSALSFRNCYRKVVYDARCRGDFFGEYDCVIGYHMILNDVTVMALEKTKAVRKILWLHGKKKYRDNDISFYGNLYKYADNIVSVSKDTQDRVVSFFPSLCNITTVINNFFDIEKIKNSANEPIYDFEKTGNEFRIISVGNLLPVKGFDRAIEVMSRLIADGYDVKWYIIGKGNLFDSLKNEIKQKGLEDRMMLMGYRTNPYPYIKQSDLYVQTSYSEGFCTSTMEAKILEKLVITTDCPGMNEQFTNGFDGMIVESSVDGIYNGIVDVLKNCTLLERIQQNISVNEVTNEKVLKATLEVIKGE